MTYKKSKLDQLVYHWSSIRKEKRAERIFEEIMAESLPNLMKDINVISIQEGQRIPNRINTRTYKTSTI